MSMKLITSEAQVSRILAQVVNPDNYLDYLRRTAGSDLAERLLREYALYECFDYGDIGEERHQWTLLVEEDPCVIMQYICDEEMKKRANKYWGRENGTDSE